MHQILVIPQLLPLPFLAYTLLVEQLGIVELSATGEPPVARDGSW